MDKTQMYADSAPVVPSARPVPTGQPAPPVRAATGGRRGWWWHLGEMAIAMLVGMVLLEPLWDAAGTLLGVGATLARPEVAALVMATNMTIGMSVWMRHRGQHWQGVVEMAAAMYVPFLLLFVPFRAGLLDGDALLLGGHLLMVPAMVLVALRHRHHPPTAVRRHPAVVALARRWPTGLALLMTVDIWIDPRVLSPWTMLVLPGGYLVIGLARRTLRGPRVLAIHLAGLAVWVALTLVAVAVSGRTAAWLVALGWLAHAGWDLVQHRTGRVVPHGYAEWCAVLDTSLGAVMVLAILTADG
ncbi:hypothetical protein [Micromonospora sp. NPDC005172]|uniref:hypothetical protein n=1 Tax=Micromonospora sp. NPDC005172 TaxID=3156867 RepID=UPI0033B6D0FE